MGRGNNTDLQDLVVGTLLGDQAEEEVQEEVLTLHERFTSRKNTPVMQIIDEGRKLEKLLFRADPEQDQIEIRDEMADWAAFISGNTHRISPKVGWRPSGGWGVAVNSEALFMLHDYLREPTNENKRKLYYFVRGYDNALECMTTKTNMGLAIDFLQEKWGEDTAEKLHQITGVSKATTKKWLQGGNPSSSNKQGIEKCVEVIYTLENDCWMSPKEAQMWLETPMAELDGKTPFEKLTETAGRYSKHLPEFEEVLQQTFEETNQSNMRS